MLLFGELVPVLLPEEWSILPEWLLPPQVSETIFTSVTLKVLLEAPVLPDDVADIPFSQVPFTLTSCPTWADTSCPAKATVLPFLVSSMNCPPWD